MKIPFYQATITGSEIKNIEQLMGQDGAFMQNRFVEKCENWFVENHGVKNFFLTKSCTQSLELAAIALDIKQGDEVILPSYAYVACANAFVLRGATCVFVDIHPGCMNIDETKVEAAISAKTRAIVTLNYCGVSCNYEALDKLKRKHNLFLVEDNAHGTCAKYENRFLGTFGDISTFSFDHMKNISCGQGGGISVNNENLLEKFLIHYECGTNRRSFIRKETSKYEWTNLGSNYRLSELNAAMLYAQLCDEKKINSGFMNLWKRYAETLKDLVKGGMIEMTNPSPNYKHNSYCFFIKVKNIEERNALLQFLSNADITAQFHYIPLHSSEFGKQRARFVGEDIFTTTESQKLIRLPLYYSMAESEVDYVAKTIQNFYNEN